MRGAARRALLFVPSLALGVLGGAWVLLRPWPFAVHVGVAGQLLAGVLSAALLLGAAWLLERSVPSFRYASRLMENALRAVSLPAWTALLLAAATAGAEELFFRGGLLPLIGVIPQALLFGLFHPVPRRAWAYPVFAAVAGLVFGELTLVTGSLLPAVVAHFAVNLQGLWEVRRPAAGRQRDGTAKSVAVGDATLGAETARNATVAEEALGRDTPPESGPPEEPAGEKAPGETPAHGEAVHEDPTRDETAPEAPDERSGPA